jgi:titin
LKIECQLNGQPKPTVKWYKNTDELLNNEKFKLENKQDTYTLTIKDCSFKERGLYRVEAQNNCGVSISKLFIEVNTLPVIVKGLSNSEVTLSSNDQTLEFITTYQSKPKAEAIWILGDKQINIDNSHYSVAGESSKDSNDQEIFISKLIIQNLSLSDAGSYKCKLKNCVGEIVSSGTLSILKGQLFIQKLTPNLELNEKSETKLECKIEDSNPKSVVSWFKDGNPLAASKRFVISKPSIDQENNATVYSLTILDLVGTDSGEYTVKSVSKIATIDSTCQLNVLSAPKITKDLKPSLQCVAGEQIKLEVTAIGKPEPEYKWFRLNEENNENEILSNDSICLSKNGNIYSLSFNKITRVMKGTYTLRLLNIAGSAEATCTILIDGLIFNFNY